MAASAPARLGSRSWTRLPSVLAFDKIGGVYVLVVIIIYFSLSAPDKFPTWDTARQVLNGNAIEAMAALALLIPLSAGVFDISIAYTMSFSGVIATYSIVNWGFSIVWAVLAGIAAGAVVGTVNGMVVVVMKIPSLIGTLATGSIIEAVITMITKGNSITSSQLVLGFSDIATRNVKGVTAPVFYAIAIALVIWFIHEHTATGRRLYAIGFNADAARLAGLRTQHLTFASLVIAGGIAGATGVVLASSIGAGSPSAGSSYLLSTFAAVFLGATQLKEGRFNAWGTMIAVLLLGTGVTGLALSGAAAWAQSLFIGIVLISALAVTGLQQRGARSVRKEYGASRPDSPSPSPESGPEEEHEKERERTR